MRRGDLEIHAYTLLTTHFHLLVRSPRGTLSEAMRRIENPYVRHFNRLRSRDGPLFKGRFYSRLVESRSYWKTLVRYIDQNAVAARLASRGTEYPHCSAFQYAREAGPLWLSRHVVEDEVCSSRGLEAYDPDAYGAVFGAAVSPELEWVVRRREEYRAKGEDPLDDLLGAAPRVVKAWLLKKARLADHRVLLQPILAPGAVQTWIEKQRMGEGGKERRVWRVLAAGLFRDFCGLTVKEISLRLESGLATTNRDLANHLELQSHDAMYLELLTRCISELVASAYMGFAGKRKICS